MGKTKATHELGSVWFSHHSNGCELQADNAEAIDQAAFRRIARAALLPARNASASVAKLTGAVATRRPSPSVTFQKNRLG
jgi:hypothetical protein